MMVAITSYFGIAPTTSFAVVPENQPTWFDFLLNPESLKEHVAALKSSQAVKPTAPDLICSFLERVVNAHPNAGLGCR